MSFFGAATVLMMPRGLMRLLVLGLIVVMAVYVFWKKDFWQIAVADCDRDS